jgi:hypothetical protein
MRSSTTDGAIAVGGGVGRRRIKKTINYTLHSRMGLCLSTKSFSCHSVKSMRTSLPTTYWGRRWLDLYLKFDFTAWLWYHTLRKACTLCVKSQLFIPRQTRHSNLASHKRIILLEALTLISILLCRFLVPAETRDFSPKCPDLMWGPSSPLFSA